MEVTISIDINFLTELSRPQSEPTDAPKPALRLETQYSSCWFPQNIRISLDDPDSTIRCISEDGGVILTSFASPEDVDKVNSDATTFIQAILGRRTLKPYL